MNHLHLKALREQLQINIRDMAHQARISSSNYRDIEFGRLTPTPNQLERIQQVFDRHQSRDQKRLARWNAAAGEKGGGG